MWVRIALFVDNVLYRRNTKGNEYLEPQSMKLMDTLLYLAKYAIMLDRANLTYDSMRNMILIQ